MHEVYGLDLSEPGLLQARSWRWFRIRLWGLVSAESRISRHFQPPEPKGPRTPRR